MNITRGKELQERIGLDALTQLTLLGTSADTGMQERCIRIVGETWNIPEEILYVGNSRGSFKRASSISRSIISESPNTDRSPWTSYGSSKRTTIGKGQVPRGSISNGKPWATPTAPCREATRKSFSCCW